MVMDGRHKNSGTAHSRLPVIIGFEFLISLAIDSLTFSSSFTRWNSASVPTLQCFFHNENAHVDNRHSYVIARRRRKSRLSFSATLFDGKLFNTKLANKYISGVIKTKLFHDNKIFAHGKSTKKNFGHTLIIMLKYTIF